MDASKSVWFGVFLFSLIAFSSAQGFNSNFSSEFSSKEWKEGNKQLNSVLSTALTLILNNGKWEQITSRW